MRLGRPQKPINKQQSIVKKTYFDEELDRHIKRIADEEKTSESDVLRKAFLEYMEYRRTLKALRYAA